ncbi:MAG: TetR/AcrR family transcriptional regulator [Bacillota bacterium]
MKSWEGIVITEKFTTLELAKQERILNAALEEFAEKGYERASTNRIVKKAGIGKGMLFYYFKSKRELFEYLIEYAISFVVNEYLNRIDEEETDFLEKYRQAAQCKLKAYTKNPHVFNFLGSLYINREIEKCKELEERVSEVRKTGYAKFFNNIDTSLFREDVAAEKCIKLIHWTIDGYEKDIINRLQGENLSTVDMEPFWEEFFDYIAILKQVFYKTKHSCKGEQKNGGSAGN